MQRDPEMPGILACNHLLRCRSLQAPVFACCTPPVQGCGARLLADCNKGSGRLPPQLVML